jgi:uncharacterized lipoprotein
MAAATVTTRLENNDPTTEVVVLTASDGETYVSKKFGTITAAVATANTDSDAELNVTFSGGTATINFASVTDGLVTLVLWGRK